jgi:hypothetical protein
VRASSHLESLMGLTKEDQQRIEMILMLASVVRSGGMSIDDVSTGWREAVRAHLAREGCAGNTGTIRSIIMQGQRAQRESRTAIMQELIAAGYKPYNPKQEVFTAVVREHLDGCESSEYPTATKTAQAVVGDKATKLLAKTAKKNLRQAFADNKEHPGMKRIKNLVSNSTITAAASGTVSTCLGALVDAHKLARLMGEQQRRTQALEARLAEVEAAAALANARLDIKDSGKDWKEVARAIRAVEPGITNIALGLRVDRSEGAIRKYLKSLEA